MKKKYIIPFMQVACMAEELPVAVSNHINGNSIDFNPTTMEGGDGSDAVKRNYDVWDDDWSQ